MIDASASTSKWHVISPAQVTLSGEITRETVPNLWSLIQAWKPSETGCVVSLKEASQIDSAGLAMLIELIKHAKNHKCHIMLDSVPEKLSMLIQLSHLTETFEAHL